MPRSYPLRFRRRVLDLIASGRKVAKVAELLGISGTPRPLLVSHPRDQGPRWARVPHR